MSEIEVHRITKIVLDHGQIITLRTEDESKVIAALQDKKGCFTKVTFDREGKMIVTKGKI